MPCIEVDIQVVRQWPSKEDLKSRNAVLDELNSRRIGKFQGAGGGKGAMDFSYVVPIASDAETVIREVMAQHLPNCKFSIRVWEE